MIELKKRCVFIFASSATTSSSKRMLVRSQVERQTTRSRLVENVDCKKLSRTRFTAVLAGERPLLSMIVPSTTSVWGQRVARRQRRSFSEGKIAKFRHDTKSPPVVLKLAGSAVVSSRMLHRALSAPERPEMFCSAKSAGERPHVERAGVGHR